MPKRVPIWLGALLIAVGVAAASAPAQPEDAIFAASFELEDGTAAAFVDPAPGQVAYERVFSARIAVRAGTSSVAAARIGAVAATLESASGGVAVYRADVPLQPGDNLLRAEVVFANGGMRTLQTLLKYAPPAKVSITSPGDWEVFGPLPAGSPGGATDLTGNVERPVSVTGTLSSPVVRVEINQQLAQLDQAGTAFRFERFFLHEGANALSATATDAQGRSSSAQITLYVDQTAPLLSVEDFDVPRVTSSARLDVRGVVNDAVEAGWGASEPTVAVFNPSNGRSVVARVSDRFYLAQDVPLELGQNLLQVSAIDQMGNVRSRSVEALRIAGGSRRLTLLSGDRQRAPGGALLPRPLQIAALDAQGASLPGIAVRFDVVRGAGELAASAAAVAPARSVTLTTDDAGRAAAWLILGEEAMESGNTVRASAQDLGEDVYFTATALRGPPLYVLNDGGVGVQYALTDSTPVEALTVLVRDAHHNASAGAPVRFEILQGDAHFDAASTLGGQLLDAHTLRVAADKDGRASARPRTGSDPGSVVVRVRAQSEGGAFAGESIFRLVVLDRRAGPTARVGRIFDHAGQPLAGVRLSIARTSASAVSDASGRFVFDDGVPAGKIDLFVDGRTVSARAAGGSALEYPALHFETAVVQGRTNQLPHPIYLPPLRRADERIVGADDDVVLTSAGSEGLRMTVKAHSVTFPDGSHVGPLLLTRVNGDRLPMVPPGGYGSFGGFAWTLQPSGTRFDPPIEVSIPNVTGLRPGETNEIVQWDHDLAAFVPMGRATVSEDGTLLRSDAGSGITKAGWGGGPPPVPPNTADGDDCPPSLRSDDGVCHICEFQPELPQCKCNLAATVEGQFPRWDALLKKDGATVDFASTNEGHCKDLQLTWTFGDGSPDSHEAAPAHTYSEAKSYQIFLTGTCSECTQPDAVDVSVNVFKPALHIQPDTNQPFSLERGQGSDVYYTENHVFKLEARYPEGHPKAGQAIAELSGVVEVSEKTGTHYYDGQHDATALPQNVALTAGKGDITVKSVSDSGSAATPPAPAKLSLRMVDAPYDVDASVPQDVAQWETSGAAIPGGNDPGMVDWLEMRVKERLGSLTSQPGLVGDAGRACSQLHASVSQYTNPNGPDDCGVTSPLFPNGTPQSVYLDYRISPVCTLNPGRTHRLNTQGELDNTVVHEARHCWQFEVAFDPNLGTVENGMQGAPFPNDSDADTCPEALPSGQTEAAVGDSTPFIEAATPAHSDATNEGGACSTLSENDADEFGNVHH
jgi:PKD repeat protein